MTEIGATPSPNHNLTYSYTYSLERVAQRIRAAADRIERVGQPTTIAARRETRPDHTRAAIEVVSEVQAMIGNLNLAGLLDAAKTADQHWETEPGQETRA